MGKKGQTREIFRNTEGQKVMQRGKKTLITALTNKDRNSKKKKLKFGSHRGRYLSLDSYLSVVTVKKKGNISKLVHLKTRTFKKIQLHFSCQKQTAVTFLLFKTTITFLLYTTTLTLLFFNNTYYSSS